MAQAEHAGAAGRPHPDNQALYEQLYLVLAALFIAALVSCNLIFLKFFSVPIELPLLGAFTFTQSVGLLPYPLTFLVTDILSEAYGRRRANRVVVSGIFASLFVIAVVAIADAAPAAGFSTVDDATFTRVFGLNWIAFAASMGAYLCAQFIDIRIFHFWRRLTAGRHLWLRNNASTITSQVVDTFSVLALLATLNAAVHPGEEAGVTWSKVGDLFVAGVAFKMIVALCDTPLFYVATAAFKRWFPVQFERAHEETREEEERLAILADAS